MLCRNISRLTALSLSQCISPKVSLARDVDPVVAQCCRCLNTSSQRWKESPNQDYVISPVYSNRNPRNLEKLGLAKKRLGWKLQAPRKDYYHKLVISRSHRNTDAWVEHFTGEVVLSASTKEWALCNQLYSRVDVTAASGVGKILAQRCLESGITAVFLDEAEVDVSSESNSAFLQAFKDVNVSLTEPEMIVPEYKPGIDYDGFNRYAEPKVWKEDYQDI